MGSQICTYEIILPCTSTLSYSHAGSSLAKMGTLRTKQQQPAGSTVHMCMYHYANSLCFALLPQVNSLGEIWSVHESFCLNSYSSLAHSPLLSSSSSGSSSLSGRKRKSGSRWTSAPSTDELAIAEAMASFSDPSSQELTEAQKRQLEVQLEVRTPKEGHKCLSFHPDLEME